MIITRKEIPFVNLKDKVVGITSGCFGLFHFLLLEVFGKMQGSM